MLAFRQHLLDTYPDSSSCRQAVTTKAFKATRSGRLEGGCEPEPPIRSFGRDLKYVRSPTFAGHSVLQLQNAKPHIVAVIPMIS